jgi:hypothetical protein
MIRTVPLVEPRRRAVTFAAACPIRMRGYAAVDPELHQLTLRYERLRKRQLREERALLVSLTEIGQQLPEVVTQEAPSFILIDGWPRRLQTGTGAEAPGARHGTGDLPAGGLGRDVAACVRIAPSDILLMNHLDSRKM